MRGNIPQTCKHLNSPNNDIKSSLGYFHISWTFPMSLNCILKILGEAQGKFPCGNIPRDSTGKYPHRKFPFIPHEFPEGNYEEFSAGMIPRKSPLNPDGNLGDVDGSPAGTLLSTNSVECRTVYSLYTLIQQTRRRTLI